MKNLFVKGILIIVLGILLFQPKEFSQLAHAQGVYNGTRIEPTVEQTQTRVDSGDLSAQEGKARQATQKTDSQVAAEIKANEETKAAENSASDSLIKCSLGWDLPACWTAKLSSFVLKISSNVLYMSAKAFDWAINYSLNIAKIMTDMPIVTVGWKILLNVTNLAYIFILLFVAICMILGISKYGDKALIARIILTAIFVNFSLFGTKLVIDVTNIVALQFYNLMKPSSTSSSTPTDVSEQFMKPLGLTTLFSNPANTTTDGSISAIDTSGTVALTDYWKIALLCLLGSIFVITTAFVFLAGAFLFISRTLVLLFLMMFSSFAFAANVLPNTQKHFTTWSQKLIGNAIFAPVFIGLMYILITALQASSTFSSGSSINFASMILNGNFTSGFITFFMIQGAMVGILIISAKTGIAGGSMAAGMVDKRFGLNALAGYGKSIGLKTGRMVGGATLGAGKAVAVRTGGRLATAIAESGAARTFARYTGTSGMLSKVAEKVGYQGLRDKKAKGFEARDKYLGGVSAQGRNEEDKDYKIRKDKAKARALGRAGLNKDGSRVATGFGGFMNTAQSIIGGSTWRGPQTEKAKKIKKDAKTKDKLKKDLALHATGLGVLIGAPAIGGFIDASGDPDYAQIQAAYESFEKNTNSILDGSGKLITYASADVGGRAIGDKTVDPKSKIGIAYDAYDTARKAHPTDPNNADVVRTKKDLEKEETKLESQFKNYFAKFEKQQAAED